MNPLRTMPAKLAVLLWVLALSGCSIYSLPGGEPAPVEEASTGPRPAPRPETPEPAYRDADPAASAAYRPLLEEAEACTTRGDYERALALQERAQRIDPDSAEIYLAMARTHNARGDRSQARATAERGLLYCTSKAQCDALRGYIR